VNGIFIGSAKSAPPEGRILQKSIDYFVPPPMGHSMPSDFNPTVHLRIPEKIVEEEDPDNEKDKD